jgi:hypothetical protein
MSDQLVIVFLKNPEKGKVKTRLAKDVGDDLALEVYQYLTQLTVDAATSNRFTSWIYYSNHQEQDQYSHLEQGVQNGLDLGERMFNAFQKGFNQGFKKVIIIGSDLPDMSEAVLINAFEELNRSSVVLGKASDGGYYLIGQSYNHEFLFRDMPWSEEGLMEKTLEQLDQNRVSVTLLEEMNDVDTIDDLKDSSAYINFKDRIEHERYNSGNS